MLNVVETSTKTFCLYRFCLSTSGGTLSGGGVCPTANHLIFEGILSGGINFRGDYVWDSYFHRRLQGVMLNNAGDTCDAGDLVIDGSAGDLHLLP